MKRRFFAMLLSLAMLFTLAPTAFAADGGTLVTSGTCGATQKDNVTWTLKQNNEGNESPTYTLTISGSGAMADYYAQYVQRKDEFTGDIAPWRRALLHDPSVERTTEEVVPITEVVIGDGVTRIGSGAFAYTALTGTVTFNANVTSYGDGVFARDTSITAVDWTNFKPTEKITDGWATVYEKEHIAIPYAFFDGCSSLDTSIVDGTTYSGQLVLPDTIKAIYVAAFRGTGFSKVDFSNGLANIKAVGSYAISGLENMTEFTYPGNVDFYGMDDNGRNNVINGGGLQKLTIAKEVTELPAYFCTNTEHLTTVEVEGGSQLTTIGTDAFTENNALKSIDISSPVTSVGEKAFFDCGALESVKIQGSSDVVYPSNIFSAWTSNGRKPAPLKTLKIAAGKIQFSLSNQKDSIETVVLGDGVTEIPINFANGCTKLKSVSLPDALTSVPTNAFQGCSSLERVGISENSKLQSIGSGAFANSTLTQIYIPKGVTSIGQGAFNRTPITVFDMSDVLADHMTVGLYAINNWYSEDDQANWPSWKNSFKCIYVSNSGAAASVKEQTSNCNYAFFVTNGGSVDATKNGFAAVSRAGYSVTWTSSKGTTVTNPETANLQSGETYTATWKLLDNNVEITYKPNISGGNDKDVVRVAVKGADTTVASALFSRTGYTFAGWNTKADGTGDTYKTGNTIKASNMTLYAQWTLDKPTISGTATAVYGDPVTLTANTAASDATYQWCKDDKEIPKATNNSLTLTDVADSGAYTVKITVGNDTATSKTATSEPTTVTITKATPSISISADPATMSGSGTVKLTVTGAPTEGSVKVTCNNDITVTKNDNDTFTATLPNQTKTYTFTASYAGDDNHAEASNTCQVSVTRHTSSSSSSNPTYSVTTPSKSENGKVSLDKSTAKKGDTVTVTVTPDAGYQLDKLTVTDKNGNVLKLTDKGDGKYSFTMPDGKVEVKAVFAKEVETSPFGDVSTDAYYYKAVQWAQEKGITDGISSNLFGPKQPCTRSQIVTFLWRAAGSPEPKSTAAGMTDVAPGSYYAKAVAWAVENGITTGTAEGTFSPDATCTRAQAVTFLARAQNAKATGKTAFSDVPADSYFADAVAWAQANGVTTGTSETTFSPDSDCTRAQIVTFLYRANQGT